MLIGGGFCQKNCAKFYLFVFDGYRTLELNQLIFHKEEILLINPFAVFSTSEGLHITFFQCLFCAGIITLFSLMLVFVEAMHVRVRMSFAGRVRVAVRVNQIRAVQHRDVG